MQRHEIDSAAAALWLVLPAAGWLAAAYALGLPLRPMPQALTIALRSTPASSVLMAGLLTGGVLAAAGAWLLREFGDDGFRGEAYRRWLRGARLANWHTVAARVRAANRRENARRRRCEPSRPALSAIRIGPMPMPLHLENRNLLICASVGAGKSVAMESMMASTVRRRDRMVVVDPNGTFLSKFGFPGDVVLNPFDRRSVGWSVFNEVHAVHDFDRIARSVIPPQRDVTEEQWCAYARDVLADTMRKLVETNRPDQEALVDLLVREDGEAIRAFLVNTDSQGYFRDNAEKAIASVQFMMNKYVRPLRHLRAGDFSLHRWVQDPGGGNLFLTWREDMRAAQRPLIATWIDTICATMLSTPAGADTRLWLYLDELDALGMLESFVPAATRGRKHGVRMVASIQDWAQLDQTYGRDAARTVLACFRNYLIFGASNACNAQKASEILGRQHVERRRVTASQRGASRQVQASPPEPAVLDAEIANLKDLTGYVAFAEDFPVARISIPYVDYPERMAPIQT
ncbi:type IV secretion system DNA-binding domain-containing protein [Cupriavidus respiraculi]|uniref:Type IV secretion system coupling protein TraD DNA-binding domain-containing protein n=1 Tax=Cupriavidus respiraculi TaxID=195930 RepID=A0ABN7ZH67_9BURK|nr:type IV secretion system DNA-binding domain-containing protein [Cupriavidus respiraculi]MBY4949549.1 type IV secretion system DNA-binding domain-containing protein [Cupriavidus respiraculi]CAG9184041.1 hypothetical protein LMG21510_05008 [Cupriavidus respiraculi]